MPQDLHQLIHQSASFIANHQLPSGAIPWYKNGVTDPWDQVECAIALDWSGRPAEAKRAYMWLRQVQNPDGSWWYSYLNDQPLNLTKDPNYSSYIATGLWCHYLATGDVGFLGHLWPAVEKSMAFALALQQPTGEIHCSRDTRNVPWPKALLASSSCTWLSARCAIGIARTLGHDRPDWEAATEKLSNAIRERPELFDTIGYGKRHYAVSWFYPVLAGIINGERARKQLLEGWGDFIIDNWGCKCVIETPWWVTVAETCELAMALIRAGERDRAGQLLSWILRLQDSDGSFWTGIKIPEEMIWPEQKPTWASAAAIMAAAQLDEQNELAASFCEQSSD